MTLRSGIGFRIGLWLGAAIVVGSPGVADVATRGLYRPVNYFTFLPPLVGSSYVDPGFGVTIKRISDATSAANAADVGTVPFIVNEYATASPFNSDASLLLLQHHSYFALYDGDGAYLRDLPLEIGAASEPRWSPSEREVLYYLAGNELKRYDVATGEVALVRLFAEYARISGTGESDLSPSGGHLALVGDGREIFVYRISTDDKGPVLNTDWLGAFDFVCLTPENRVLVGWLATGPGRFHGIELYDSNMNFLRQVSLASGHMDVARDVSGEEVALLMNAADPSAPADCQNALVKIRLADGARTCLVMLDWSLAAHVSAADGGGWVVLSTYSSSDPDPATAWREFTGEIVEVALDGSAVRRLAHHRSRPANAYWWTPRASVSRDGRKVVFSSNYGLQQLLGYPTEYVDAYLIDRSLPASSSAGSQEPAARRVEDHDPQLSYTCPGGASWYANGLTAHSAGGARLAMDAGCAASFSFVGTAMSWIGYRDEWGGIARVSVDGAWVGDVDTYAWPARSQATTYTVSGLPHGRHVVRIEVSGERGPASNGAWVWVDAFDLLERIEQDHPATTLTCPAYVTWYAHAWSVHSEGLAALATNEGCRVSFAFDGTAVSWIGYRDAWSGIARVSVDGLVRAEIDTYSPADQRQARVYTLTGLDPGPHTLTIEVTGRRHPSSAGAWIWIDGFETPARP